MSWSFVGANKYGPSGVASVVLTLPAGVQGGDLIVVYSTTFQTTGANVTCAALTTQYNQSCLNNASTHWGYVATRIAAGTAGSATSDTTFTLTFGGGTSSWGVATIFVIRSTSGVGTVANKAILRLASYKTSPLTSAALTVGNAGDATIYGYGGVTSAASETYSAFADTSLSNVTFWNSTPANGCLAGVGWGTGVSSPAAATFTNSGGTGVDQFNWGLDVTVGSVSATATPATVTASASFPSATASGNAVITPATLAVTAYSTVARPYFPVAGVSLDTGAYTAGGALILPCVNAYSSALSGSILNLAGSSVDIRVDGVPPLGNGSTEFIFHVMYDLSNYFMIWYGDAYAGLTCRMRQAAVNTDHQFVTTYSGTTHKYWRIRELSGTVYFGTSPDRATWTEYSAAHSLGSTLITTMRLSMNCGWYGTETNPGPGTVGAVNTA